MINQIKPKQNKTELLSEILTFQNIERGLTDNEKEILYTVEYDAVARFDFKLAYLIAKLIAIQGIASNGGMPVAKEIIKHMKLKSKNELKALPFKETEGFRRCTKCKCYMVEGFYNEENGTYYCTKTCLDSDVTSEDKKEWVEEGALFWTDWLDEAKVFTIFDNQYVSLEDAEYIQENQGNPTEKIAERDFDVNAPLYTLNKGVQIEISVFEEVI